MKRCLHLAQKGLGNVSPNPMVGAVLVHDNKIIGEGFHEKYGYEHAEVNCINSVTEENKHFIKDSTLYVSLEPCNHFGKTPPCTDLIISHNIKKVVVGCMDIHSKVNGKGIDQLKKNGVDVIEGVLEKEAIKLNKRFFVFHHQQRPYVILKWAQSANGKISGPAKSRIKITNELTDKLVHKWRSEEDAIMVGTNTVVHDNPSLTTRLFPGKNPIRIIIDKTLRTSLTSSVYEDIAPTIIFNFIKNAIEGTNRFIKLNDKDNIIAQINSELYKLNVMSVIIEGGAALLNDFIQQNVWDEARIITNRKLFINDGLDAPIINGKSTKVEKIQNDCIEYFEK